MDDDFQEQDNVLKRYSDALNSVKLREDRVHRLSKRLCGINHPSEQIIKQELKKVESKIQKMKSQNIVLFQCTSLPSTLNSSSR